MSNRGGISTNWLPTFLGNTQLQSSYYQLKPSQLQGILFS